jgi:phenylacetate 2-hydroxylase
MILLWIGIIIIIYLVYQRLSSTDVPKIDGLLEAAGWPVFGSLFELGDNHSAALSRMSKNLGPVFQIRMGNKRIVVANSYDSIKELWTKNQSALISRPTLHTFHAAVSSSQGFTIGTSPWDESCKQRRKAVATALNKPAVQTYMPIIDFESYSVIVEILKDSEDGQLDSNVIPYIRRFTLNTTLTLTYGTRISSSSDKLLQEIVEVQGAIGRFRSTSNNWQDYVPALRLIPGRSNEANSYRMRRDRYIVDLLDDLRKNIANGTDKPCITGNILKDPLTKLNEVEVKSICLSMVSGGIESTSANIIFGIGYLSSPHGQKIQERAYTEIQSVYPDGDAWDKCLIEEEVPYVTALYKEILRYYTISPMSLPRRSVEDIEYNGSIIPAGTSFYMNAFAGNYDEDHFEDPYTFNPERFLDNATSMPHCAYGAGSRICPGAHLANRQLYSFFMRLISAFRILPPLNKEHEMILDAMEANGCTAGLIAEPKPFKCRFEIRNKKGLDCWLESNRRRAESHW